ncbi:YfhO family protein [Latilactobacillus fragifolii]|uniref:YfhO family protein n=1 Tax=Latilactobacillus fragifolii TaxID=2814244 RepID=UPI001ABACC1C|nr:YfhO family protein [Latilactobacillus fragifolii]
MKKKRKSILDIMLLVGLLLAILVGLSIYEGLYPFGDKLWIRADSYTQYSVFYKYLREQLLHGGSLFYSFKLGLGGSFFTIMGYYLMSPLGFLVVLFKNSQIMFFMTILIVSKIILSGVTFYLFINKRINLEYIYCLGLSISYALMSFNIIYAFNIMWLDSIIIIPIALIGVDYLIDKGKIALLTGSLTLLFISNFYMAYMAGIGIFIYFIAELVIIGNREKVESVVKFLFSVVISFGLSAWLILPINYALKLGPKVPLQLDFLQRKQSIWMALSDLFSHNKQLFDGADIYCGILMLIATIAFYFIPKIKTRIKAIVCVLEICLLLSYIYEYPYIMWHGFQQPTGYGFRFSFLISLIMILITGFVINIGLEKLLKPLGYAVLLCGILLVTLYKKQIIDSNALIANTAMLGLFSFVMLVGYTLYRNKGVNMIKWLVLGIIIADSIQNMHFIISHLNSLPGYVATEKDWNTNDNQNLNTALDYIKKDKTFYRAVVTPNAMLNQGMYNNFNGFSWFNTFGYQQLATTLSQFGYSTTLGSKSLAYQEGNTIADSLLGLKYRVALTTDLVTSIGYRKIFTSGKYNVYQNKNALPIAIINDNLAVNQSLEGDNLQRQLFFFNKNGRSAIIQSIDNPSFVVHNVKIVQKDNAMHLSPCGKDAYIKYKLDIPANSELLTKVDVVDGVNSYGKLDFKTNQVVRNSYPNFHNEGVLSLYKSSNYKKSIDIKMSLRGNATILGSPKFTILNGISLEKNIKVLRKEAPKVIKKSENAIQLQANSKHGGMVFFSIPFDKSWQATVNGKSVLLSDNHGFMQLPIKSGKSNIEIRYIPQGVKEGILITSITILILISFEIKRYLEKRS